MDSSIRAMTHKDVPRVAEIHSRCFQRQAYSQDWIECNFKAFPRTFCFVAVSKGQTTGYIIWMQKSGFRKNVILELDQIGVDPKYQNAGVATRLIQESFAKVEIYLSERQARVIRIFVSTSTDNIARHLYEKALGVKQEAVIKDYLPGSNECILVWRRENGGN